MVRVVRSCSEEGCPYEGSHMVQRPLCEWHWHLWFSYGDESLALEDMRRNRANDPTYDCGHQRPITYLDRVNNDAARRFAADMGNAAETIVEVRTDTDAHLRLVVGHA